MELAEYVTGTYLPSRVRVSAGYAAKAIRWSNRYTLFIGGRFDLAEFSESEIGAFLGTIAEDHAAITVNSVRKILLTLWRAAYEDGLIDRPPRAKRVRCLPEETDPPEAWSLSQVSALFAYVATLTGTIGGIPARLFWGSLFGTVYWTAERIGAVKMTPSDAYVRGKGVLIRKRKNARPVWYPLPETCCNVIDQTFPSSRELLFPIPWKPWNFCKRAREVIEGAGLPCRKHKSREIFHRLRRTTLTACAAVDPAIAQRQAGHSDYATTVKSYIDPRLCRGKTAVDILPDPMQPRLRIQG